MLSRRNEEREKEKEGIFMDNFLLMLGVGFVGWLVHYLWHEVPYTVIFKHFTVSEYVNRKYYLHSPVLAYFSNIERRNQFFYHFSMLYGIA